MSRVFCAVIACATLMRGVEAVSVQRDPVHLRAGERHKWRTFPGEVRGHEVSFSFEAELNDGEHSLLLRQRDVRNTNSTVTLNGRKLGVLTRGYREMTSAFAVPAGVLRSGANVVKIAGMPSGTPDDIAVREVRIEPSPVTELLQQTTLEVRVASEAGPLPVKITVTDQTGALAPFISLRPIGLEAIRTGVLYTPDGKARIGLMPGRYRVYASRGFEYSAPSSAVNAARGKTVRADLKLSREVVLAKYVSADPHIHTLELSGHGDSSVDERVLTAAGEGLDIAIATEHDRPASYEAAIRKQKLHRWVVSVPGTEITTAIGHFNIFPVVPGSRSPILGSGTRRLCSTASGGQKACV